MQITNPEISSIENKLTVHSSFYHPYIDAIHRFIRLKIEYMKGRIKSIDTSSKILTVIRSEAPPNEPPKSLPVNEYHHTIEWYSRYLDQEVSLELWVTEETNEQEKKYIKYYVANVVGAQAKEETDGK